MKYEAVERSNSLEKFMLSVFQQMNTEDLAA